MITSRRKWALSFPFAFVSVYSRPLLFAAAPALSVRGRLEAGEKPVLALPDGRRIHLESDEGTMKVLADERLKDADLEILGHWKAADLFTIDPIYTRSMFVHKDGKRLMITHWCDVCYIRTYSPGKCWCCQKYTDLDLRETDQP